MQHAFIAFGKAINRVLLFLRHSFLLTGTQLLKDITHNSLMIFLNFLTTTLNYVYTKIWFWICTFEVSVTLCIPDLFQKLMEKTHWVSNVSLLYLNIQKIANLYLFQISVKIKTKNGGIANQFSITPVKIMLVQQLRKTMSVNPVVSVERV